MNVVAHQLKCNDPDFRAIVRAHRDNSHRKRIHLRIAKNDRMILRRMQVIKGTKITKRLLKKAFAPTFLIQKRMSHGDRRQMSGIENIRNHNPTLFLLQRHYGSGCTRKLQPKPPESKKKIKKSVRRARFPAKACPDCQFSTSRAQIRAKPCPDYRFPPSGARIETKPCPNCRMRAVGAGISRFSCPGCGVSRPGRRFRFRLQPRRRPRRRWRRGRGSFGRIRGRRR